MNLEWEEGTKVKAPLLCACPISVKCKVTQKTETGDDHVFFIGSIEAIHSDEAWLDENRNLDFTKISVM